MTPPLLAAAGMFHGHDVLSIEQLLDHPVVHVDGLVLTPIVDVLAIMRIDADADLVVVHHRGGGSRALRIAELARGNDVFLHVQSVRRTGVDENPWSARLWSQRSGPSSPVESLRATTFEAFVSLT
jgi:hypothetical protein